MSSSKEKSKCKTEPDAGGVEAVQTQQGAMIGWLC